jgi:hypothetical protein
MVATNVEPAPVIVPEPHGTAAVLVVDDPVVVDVDAAGVELLPHAAAASPKAAIRAVPAALRRWRAAR